MPVALHEDRAVYSQACQHRLLCFFNCKYSKLLRMSEIATVFSKNYLCHILLKGMNIDTAGLHVLGF